jgi:hypothetical protein
MTYYKEEGKAPPAATTPIATETLDGADTFADCIKLGFTGGADGVNCVTFNPTSFECKIYTEEESTDGGTTGFVLEAASGVDFYGAST